MSEVYQPVAVITGGSQGLGYSLAKVLLQKGFAVSICARTKADLQKAEATLSQHGPVYAISGDVSGREFREQFIHQTIDRFGRIDALVNNASTLGQVPLPALLDVDVDKITDVFSVNTIAPLHLIQLVWPHFQTHTNSLIIGISSDAAIGGYPTWGIYGASKTAADLFYKTLANELAESRVTIYSVDPGDMQTAMHHRVDPNASGLRDPHEVANVLATLFTPLVSTQAALYPSGSRLRISAQEIVEG